MCLRAKDFILCCLSLQQQSFNILLGICSFLHNLGIMFVHMYVWVSVTTPLYRIAQPSLWFLATLLAGLLSSTATTEGEDRCEIMKFVSLISRQWCHVYVSNGTYIYIYNQHTS